MGTPLDDFKELIRNADYTMTYKMAWAKAIVTLCVENKDWDSKLLHFSIAAIAEKMLGFYWNQTIFFKLVQGTSSSTPNLVNIVNEMIDYYAKNNQTPEKVQKVRDFIHAKAFYNNPENNGIYNSFILKASKVVKKDVAWRFTYLNRHNYASVYSYQKGDDVLFIPLGNAEVFKDNSQDLIDLINYRWSLMLENFNSSPRICKKVRLNSDEDVHRSPLSKFDKFLDLENKDHICFICGKKIDEKELSIDHVIPWSYLYSDDIWNLVYVHRSCNSVKSDEVPDAEMIKRLKERNIKLIKALEENGEHSKIVSEMDLAIKNDYVDKFYAGCKGF